MKFYIDPPADYKIIKNDDLIRAYDNIEYLKEHENVNVFEEFYSKADKNGMVYYDFVYNTNGNIDIDSDTLNMFLGAMREIPSVEKSYQEICDTEEYALVMVDFSDAKTEDKQINVYTTQKRKGSDSYIPSDITLTYRYYLKRNCMSYEDYANRSSKCFPDIVFHDSAFDRVEKLGRYSSKICSELTRHLAALNDVAMYLYEFGKDKDKVLQHLQAKCNVNCSGKGENESKDYKMEIAYHGKSHRINCQPHTKLFEVYLDKRIYFSWGINEIENHAIIVARIGDHFYQ